MDTVTKEATLKPPLHQLASLVSPTQTSLTSFRTSSTPGLLPSTLQIQKGLDLTAAKDPQTIHLPGQQILTGLKQGLEIQRLEKIPLDPYHSDLLFSFIFAYLVFTLPFKYFTN